jgi:hypothetical protein
MINYDAREDRFKQIYTSLRIENKSTESAVSSYRALFYHYYQFLLSWDILIQGYKSFQGETYFTVEEIFDMTYTDAWLFYSFHVENFEDKLATFIITNNITSANASESYLLFYISLQDAEFQATLEGVPSPLLADMFYPIIQENTEAWLEDA